MESRPSDAPRGGRLGALAECPLNKLGAPLKSEPWPAVIVDSITALPAGDRSTTITPIGALQLRLVPSAAIGAPISSRSHSARAKAALSAFDHLIRTPLPLLMAA
jgi:hypothetical protein